MTTSGWPERNQVPRWPDNDETARIPTNPGPDRPDDDATAYEDAKARFLAPPAGQLMMVPDLPTMSTVELAGPTWNGFDTFLRRALMIVANILLWGMLFTGLLFGIGGVALLNHFVNEPASTSEVDPAFDPGTYGEPLCPDAEIC